MQPLFMWTTLGYQFALKTVHILLASERWTNNAVQVTTAIGVKREESSFANNSNSICFCIRDSFGPDIK